MTTLFSRNGVTLPLAAGTRKPAKIVFEKSPVSPSRCPVAMVEALAVVNVGKMECEFSNRTPARSSAHIAGASRGVTELGRSPSATNRMTLCWT